MKKVAFFVGSDITSHLVLQDTLILLKKYDMYVEVFFPTHQVQKKQLPQEIILLGKYERGILNDVVFPFLLKHNITSHAKYSAPEFLSSIYNANIAYVMNINDQQFKKYIFDIFDGIISIRCYQKFDEDYVKHFSSNDKFICNLHPGDLPHYRGVMTCIRAMKNSESTHTYTLHLINTDWDAGLILKKMPVTLNNRVSMLENMCNLYPTGSVIIDWFVKMFYDDKYILGIKQSDYHYYSFPTKYDIAMYDNQNLKLYDHDFMLSFYIDKFLPKDSKHIDYFCELILTYLTGGI